MRRSLITRDTHLLYGIRHVVRHTSQSTRQI